MAAEPTGQGTVAVRVRLVLRGASADPAQTHRACKVQAEFHEAQSGAGRQTLRMVKTALRFLLLRFLPGRLVPLLTVIEVVRVVRRLWKGRSTPAGTPPRRLRTVGDGPGRNPSDLPVTAPVDAPGSGVSRPGS